MIDLLTAYPTGYLNLSPRFAATVGGESVFVSALPFIDPQAPSPEEADVALDVVHLAADGPLEFEVACSVSEMHHVRLSPLRLDIPVERDGDRLRFTLEPGYHVLSVRDHGFFAILVDRPGQGSVGVEETRLRRIGPDDCDATGGALVTDVIQAAFDAASEQRGRRTVMIEPGVYRCGRLHLRSGLDLFLSPGAVLLASADEDDYPEEGADGMRFGFIRGDGCKDVTLRGFGAFDGNGIARRAASGRRSVPGNLMELDGLHGLRVVGVTLRDNANWAFHQRRCHDSEVRDVKILGFRALRGVSTNDGFDVNTCSDVLIDHAFVHNGDDSTANMIKPRGTSIMKFHQLEPTDGVQQDATFRHFVTVNNSTACKVGAEMLGKAVRNLLFEHFDVVRCERAVVIEACDDADVSGITYRDIHVESFQTCGREPSRTIDIQIQDRGWRLGRAESAVGEVLIDGLHCREAVGSVIVGRSERYAVRGVTIRDFTVNGRRMTSVGDAFIETNRHAEVTFDSARV